MNAINKSLKSKLLPAFLIIRNFIREDLNCNYEKYLTEIINISEEFTKRFGKPFKHVSDESHGECDVYSGEYGLDFKLVASTTSLQAVSIFTSQITVRGDGWRVWGECKNPRGRVTATRLYAALRNKSTSDLEVLLNSSNTVHGIEKDLMEFLNNIIVNKNLLLFFPYEFSFDESKPEFDEAIKIITEALNLDFVNSIGLRKQYANEYDTYGVFIYENHFIILTEKEGILHIIDDVNGFDSKTFSELLLSYDLI